MHISDKGVALLKQLEGSVKHNDIHIIYDDQTGKPINANKPLPKGATIGYGHLIMPGENFRSGITEYKATELLRQDLLTAENAVQNNITVNLTQNQFDALVILVYNIGIKNFINSTLARYVNNPDFQSLRYPTMEMAWKAWNKSGGQVIMGLNNRRNQEWNLFTNGGVGAD